MTYGQHLDSPPGEQQQAIENLQAFVQLKLETIDHIAVTAACVLHMASSVDTLVRVLEPIDKKMDRISASMAGMTPQAVRDGHYHILDRTLADGRSVRVIVGAGAVAMRSYNANGSAEHDVAIPTNVDVWQVNSPATLYTTATNYLDIAADGAPQVVEPLRSKDIASQRAYLEIAQHCAADVLDVVRQLTAV